VDYGGAPFEQMEDGRWAIRNGDDLLIVDGNAKVEAAPGSIVRHPKPKRSEHHPTQKPVQMLTRLMQNSGRQNDLVIEPFSGSGSTLMASELLGMCCRASELDPGYVDVAVRRWQAYSGRSAVHAVTGEIFPVTPDKCVSF
jgi:DNA modification methylase